MEESDVDLAEGFADSDKGGQETAPITGITSVKPLDGFFQAVLSGLLALFLVSAMELSTAETSEIAEPRDEEEDDDGANSWWSGWVTEPRTT